jgi:hypothetical protein
VRWIFDAAHAKARQICALGAWFCRVRWYLFGLVAALIVTGVAYFIRDFRRDEAQTFYDDPIKQFKYGSTGGDRLAGIPVGIFKALPILCRDYLR